MQIEHVAVSTITLAREPDEARVLTGGVSRLASLRAPVFVADGGSGPELTAQLARLSNVTLVPPDGAGFMGQVRASLGAAAAAGSAFVLYTEPDKERFFEHALQDFVRRAPAGPDVGVVVASRSARAFATFPPMQRRTETMINELVGEALGRRADYCYGPFLVRRELVDRIALVPGPIGWGWRPFVFATARRLGYQVLAVGGDFHCPQERREEDERERIHRLRQLSENIAGLVLGLTAAVHDG